MTKFRILGNEITSIPIHQWSRKLCSRSSHPTQDVVQLNHQTRPILQKPGYVFSGITPAYSNSPGLFGGINQDTFPMILDTSTHLLLDNAPEIKHILPSTHAHVVSANVGSANVGRASTWHTKMRTKREDRYSHFGCVG